MKYLMILLTSVFLVSTASAQSKEELPYNLQFVFYNLQFKDL